MGCCGGLFLYLVCYRDFGAGEQRGQGDRSDWARFPSAAGARSQGERGDRSSGRSTVGETEQGEPVAAKPPQHRAGEDQMPTEGTSVPGRTQSNT
jgi:hypothetical protein